VSSNLCDVFFCSIVQLFIPLLYAITVLLSIHIVTIPLFKMDVPSSSECIGFGSEFSRMEMDDEIESRKIFRPMCLLMHEDFGH